MQVFIIQLKKLKLVAGRGKILGLSDFKTYDISL